MNRLVSDRYLLRKMWVRHSLQGEGSQFLILSFLFAPLSPLVGERGWGIEGECKKLTQVRRAGVGSQD